MYKTSTYLNFERNTEEAFTFYKSVFGTEFIGGIMRHGDVPVAEGQPGPSDADRQLVMNVALPIVDSHLLMGTDTPTSMGFELVQGNNVSIGLHPETRAEADELFAALAAGGTVGVPPQVMFWGDYYGDVTDRFGVRWYVNCASSS